MRITTELLDDAVAAVHAFRGADVGSLTHGDLLDAQAAAANARRASEILLAGIAGEVARRSVAGGLARAEGFSSPQRLIATLTGGTLADAHRLVDAGLALGAGSETGSGQPNREPEVPGPQGVDQQGVDQQGVDQQGTVAVALGTGRIGIDAAGVIRAVLTRLERARDRGLELEVDVAHLERRLVAKASELNLQDLRRACEWAEATASPAAWRERELRQYEDRCVTLGSDSHGMVVLTAKLDPPSAAPVKAWLDAQVRDAFQRRRDAQEVAGTTGARDHASSPFLDVDDRTAVQIRADALVALARHGLGCDQPGAGVTTTVVVRVEFEELQAGVGLAQCDDLEAPVSVEALRCMAVDAEVIPLVMGGPSEPLDLGRKRRLFTRAQRLALVERDGGCVWCHAPPSYCDAHHIRWWSRDAGPTDLANGVLLCVSCHHRLHATGWDVSVTDGRVYMVPPAGVDPARTPRLAGREQLSVGLAA